MSSKFAACPVMSSSMLLGRYSLETHTHADTHTPHFMCIFRIKVIFNSRKSKYFFNVLQREYFEDVMFGYVFIDKWI